MIKFQQSQALTSHFESFWSIVSSSMSFTLELNPVFLLYQKGKLYNDLYKRTRPIFVFAFIKEFWAGREM